MSKDLSDRYYEKKQKQKKDSKKSLVKGIKIFLKGKKKSKQEYCRDSYKNLSEDEKQNLVEYRKSYEIHKNKFVINI